jgi:hypothetical protein
MADAVFEDKRYSEVSTAIEKLAADAHIPLDQVRAALMSGWSDAVTERSKTQPIAPEKFENIQQLLLDGGFSKEEAMYAPSCGWDLFFSTLLWSVLHDQIEEAPAGTVKFNLQAGEMAVWAFSNMLLKQQVTTRSYVGGYSGSSIRVASGLYYHLGGVRGHRIESTSLQEVDHGEFLVTTRAVYFGGYEHGVNFRIPYSQIIRFQPYSDAVGVCRNGVPEQVFVPTHAYTPAGLAIAKSVDEVRSARLAAEAPAAGYSSRIIPFPDSGWFLFNILQALASRDSASNHAAAQR